MKALITGGAGFIGSHLAERLIQAGDEVTVLDDLSTGRRENLRNLAEHGQFCFREGSACDAALVEELVAGANRIYHLAAAVGVKLIVEHPVQTIRTNVTATELVLRAAARQQVPVLVASTSEVYGKGAAVPFGEGDDLHLGPTSRSRWAYACSKALDEWLALAYAQEEAAQVVIARLFNTVGPRQLGDYGMVLPSFVRQALDNAPMTVHGDGSQSRCFADVSDVVSALERLLVALPATAGQVFNVGTDREITILDLAHMVKERTGSTSPIVLVPYEKAYGEGFEDMPRRIPDLRKLSAAIGFAPEISLESTIDRITAELRTHP